MKKALQGFFKGCYLGGILGFMGGLVFGIIWFVELFNPFRYSSHITFMNPFGAIVANLLVQVFTSLPGLFMGCLIGGILGSVFAFAFKHLPIWLRIVLSSFGAVLLHLLITEIVYRNVFFQEFAFGDLLYNYERWMVTIWVIYVFVAVLFGYAFETVKPLWPKFLRRKQPQIE